MVVSKYKINKDFIKVVVYFDDTISSFSTENDEIVSSEYTTILLKSLFYILKQPRCLSSEFVLYYIIWIYWLKMASGSKKLWMWTCIHTSGTLQ